jgi:hypothetical protein
VAIAQLLATASRSPEASLGGGVVR